MAMVVTLTPNPALDIATHVEKLMPSHKLRCGPVRRDPGGGGINVARAIHRLGGEVCAVYARGGGAGNELEELLRSEGVPQRPVPVSGHTRESFNVTEDLSNEQFRFILPGEPMSEAEWQNCIDVSLSLLAPGDYFVGSGSLPAGVPSDIYAQVVRSAKAKGAITAIDTGGPPLKASLQEGVDVLKASARELAEHLGAAASHPRGWRDACQGLLGSKSARIIAVTLGENGAVLITKSSAWHVAVPKVRASTTVGAGDSFLAGLLLKLVRGSDFPDALKYACAAGTAALFSAGTGLCDPLEVEKLYSSLAVQQL